MRSPKFATGKWANAICDRCGIRTKYLQLREETIRGLRTGIRVCESCWDPDHPQNFLDKYVTVDPQALRNARPDTGLWQSRRLFPPGNWINGQPPTAGQQVAALEAERAADWAERAKDRAQENAWLRGDQAEQKETGR